MFQFETRMNNSTISWNIHMLGYTVILGIHDASFFIKSTSESLPFDTHWLI